MVPCVCVYVPPASREGAPRENLLLISWGLLTLVGVSYTVKQTHSDTHTNTRTCITIYTVHVHVLWFYQKHSHKNLFFYTYTHMYMHTNTHELPDHLKLLNFWGIPLSRTRSLGRRDRTLRLHDPPLVQMIITFVRFLVNWKFLYAPIRFPWITPLNIFWGSNNKSVSKKCR